MQRMRDSPSPRSALLCAMRRSLVRQRQGQIGEDFSGGSVTGSRSDNLQVEYRP